MNVSGGGVNPAPGTPRRLYKTPYGNGIMTSVRPEDGMASVSLSWGAVLYCPAHLLGITDEQLVAMERDKVTPLQPSRMVAPAAASRRRHSSVDEHAEEAQKIVNRSLHQAPPGMDEEEYAKQIARARPTVAVPAPAPAPQPSAPARVPTLPFRSVKVVTECVVQLELVSIVNVLAESYLACLSNDNILAIITTLENSVEFARKFNADRFAFLENIINIVLF